MTDYVTFEQELAEALAASGNPNPADTVTPVAGGYQACQPSGTCDTFTAFTTNGAGQVTGVSVNGRPVAGRVAAGVSSSGSGLQVTGVLAYLLTDEQELTAVCFQLHDVSYQPVNNNPSVLANFSTPSGQVAVDNDYIVLLPSLLSPGTTASTCTIFATSEVTGTLDLVPNDQTGTVLVSATLTEP